MGVIKEYEEEVKNSLRASKRLRRYFSGGFPKTKSFKRILESTDRELVIAGLHKLAFTAGTQNKTRELQGGVHRVTLTMQSKGNIDQRTYKELSSHFESIHTLLEQSLIEQNFEAALEHLHLIEVFSGQIHKKALTRLVKDAEDLIRKGIHQQIDLEKEGVFTDSTRTHIYVIIHTPSTQNHHHRLHKVQQTVSQSGLHHIKHIELVGARLDQDRILALYTVWGHEGVHERFCNELATRQQHLPLRNKV